MTLNAPVLAGRKDDEEDNVDVEEGAEEAPEELGIPRWFLLCSTPYRSAD